MIPRSFRVGMVAYATKQGLGYLAKSFFDAGIVDEVLLVYHGKRPTYPDWYGDKSVPITHLPIGGTAIDEVLGRLDLMLFFETAFDWSFPGRCREKGVKTVCVPMYEWFPKGRENTFDGYLCPSALDVEYFPGNPLFQPPVDPRTWRPRTRAKRFLHNAGNVGYKCHKGTLELLRAVEYLGSDLRLTIRCQDVGELNRLLNLVPAVKQNPRVELVRGEIDYDQLFADHDVYVAPEKFNGLSLPLQEAYAAGMLVVTTNRHPMNGWLPADPLIPVSGYRRSAIGSGYLEFDEAIVNPRDIAATMDAWYNRDITDYSLKAKEWAEANSWETKRDHCVTLLEGFLCRTSC